MYLDNNNIVIKGKITFNVPNKTRKHNRQADWKRVAMVTFEGEMAYFYAWFIERRYGLKLNHPLRGDHITFINDSVREIKGGDKAWEAVRKEWEGKEVNVILNLDARTNVSYWWLRADSAVFSKIRAELGLGEPYFSYHFTIGYPNERNLEQAKYIHTLIEKFGADYN